MKLRLLIRSVSVSQLDLITLPSKQAYIYQYLSAKIVIGTCMFTQNRWKIQIERLNLP